MMACWGRGYIEIAVQEVDVTRAQHDDTHRTLNLDPDKIAVVIFFLGRYSLIKPQQGSKHRRSLRNVRTYCLTLVLNSSYLPSMFLGPLIKRKRLEGHAQEGYHICLFAKCTAEDRAT